MMNELFIQLKTSVRRLRVLALRERTAFVIPMHLKSEYIMLTSADVAVKIRSVQWKMLSSSIAKGAANAAQEAQSTLQINLLSHVHSDWMCEILIAACMHVCVCLYGCDLFQVGCSYSIGGFSLAEW